MNDKQKFILKVAAVILTSLGGWFATLVSWNAAAFTPLAFGGLLMILGSNLGAILTQPSSARDVDIALQPGVTTPDEVKAVRAATTTQTPITPQVVAAILDKPIPPTDLPPQS
jgi:hypothetical protein